MPPVNKADFKIWKPWLEETKLPQWAEELQSAPLSEALGSKHLPANSEQVVLPPNLPKKDVGGVELPIEFYKAFKTHDFVTSYANLRPKAEPRLEEIYRKFAERIKEFEPEM